MSVWDELTPAQYAVMINAIEHAYLNGVIYEYNLRVNGQRIGHPLIAPPISDDDVRSLIPRFAEVVADLLAKGWIEIRETVQRRLERGHLADPDRDRRHPRRPQDLDLGRQRGQPHGHADDNKPLGSALQGSGGKLKWLTVTRRMAHLVWRVVTGSV